MDFVSKLKQTNHKGPSEGSFPESVLPIIFDRLQAEGYRPEQDEEDRIVYKHEGIFCCFHYRLDDPEFLVVRATFDRSAYDNVHEAFLFKTCSLANYDQKVSKVYLDEHGDVVFSVEAFIGEGTPVGDLAVRMGSALISTILFFRKKLQSIVDQFEARELDEPQDEITAPWSAGGGYLN